MNDEAIVETAVTILSLFLWSNGYAPSGDWDINCSDCFRQYGSHIVITVCGRALINADRNVDSLWEKFVDYILKNNSHISNIKFSPYDLEKYSHTADEYIYLSVSH